MAHQHLESPKCRGDEKKAKLKEKYILTPKFHRRLLEGQELKGCCEDAPLIDRYYYFWGVDRDDDTETCSFYVGEHCAKEFLNLLELEPLPLIDPFEGEGSHDDSYSYSAKGDKGRERRKREPLNQELFIAIHLLCYAWNKHVPDRILGKILDQIEENPEKPVPSNVISFNTIISKDSRTLSQMNDELCEKYKNSKRKFKKYSFPRMCEIINAKGKKNHIE